MYYVYSFTNKINNKKYIGSTSNLSRRKKEHIQASYLQSCNSYNYPLQKAIRKYGTENFHFSIIDKAQDKAFFERKNYERKNIRRFKECNESTR